MIKVTRRARAQGGLRVLMCGVGAAGTAVLGSYDSPSPMAPLPLAPSPPGQDLRLSSLLAAKEARGHPGTPQHGSGVTQPRAPLPTQHLAQALDLEVPRAIMKMQGPRKAESSPCATELPRQPPAKVPYALEKYGLSPPLNKIPVPLARRFPGRQPRCHAVALPDAPPGVRKSEI